MSSKRSGGLGFDPLTLPGVDKISQNGSFYTVAVNNAKSLAKLGEGTKWCTRESYTDCMAKKYINRYKYIYILFNHDMPIMQYTPDYFQIMDVNDLKVTNNDLLNLVVEPSLTGPIEYLYNYALHVIKGRWLTGEPVIFKNNTMTYEYVRNIVARYTKDSSADVDLSNAINVLDDMTKAEIIKCGHALNFDYGMTVSCYQADSEGRACGLCDSCRFRKEGFANAGLQDPTHYQSRV